MEIFDYGENGWNWYNYSWDEAATGSGLVQADKAVDMVSQP